MKTPRFQQNSPFYEELKQSVSNYFTEKKISQTGGIRLISKAVFLMLILIVSYVALIFGSPSLGIAICFWLLISFAFIAIGFNVMHDGGHGSFSNSKVLNKLAS